MTEPTSRQMELLAFMREYQTANGMPPSLREICEAFNWASTNTPVCHLRLLLRKGLVRQHANKARGWVALEMTP